MLKEEADERKDRCSRGAFLICPALRRDRTGPGGRGTIRFEPKGAAPVVFNHEKHVAANDRKCSRCHYGLFVMEKGSNKMNMSMITKGNFCGACHNGKQAFDVEDKAQCARCHR